MDPGIHRYFRRILDPDGFFFVSVKMEIQQKGYKVSISMDYNPNVLFSVFVIIGIHQRNPSTKISMDLFSTSEEKINSKAEYKFISDEGLYNREAIFVLAFLQPSRISPTVGVFLMFKRLL